MDTYMDTKPKRKNRAIKKGSNINFHSVKNDFSIQRIFHFVNPFALPVFGGTGQEPEARLFTYLITLINQYVGYCNNFSYWDTKGAIDCTAPLLSTPI